MDYERSRNAEVDNLLSDARNWAANGYAEVRDPKTGGTPLHVAAAKGYVDVSPDNILLSIGFSSLKVVITKNTFFLNYLFTKNHLDALAVFTIPKRLQVKLFRFTKQQQQYPSTDNILYVKEYI